jgi:predicted CopG family antitoxin
MAQKNYRTIVIKEPTYEALKLLGTVTESFDSVISKLIQKQRGSEV